MQATTINRDEVDYFLKGILNPELFRDEDLNVDRRVVKIPGTDSLVIVYDQNQEDEYVKYQLPENERRILRSLWRRAEDARHVRDFGDRA